MKYVSGTNRVVENEDICHTCTHTHSTLSGVTEQRPPSLLQLNSVLLPGRGGETVQGEWASPQAVRWCEQHSGETKSVMSREGRGRSGCRGMRENMAFENPLRA